MGDAWKGLNTNAHAAGLFLSLALLCMCIARGSAQGGACFSIESFSIVDGKSKACSGESLTFRVELDLEPGARVFTYQWFKDDRLVDGTRTNPVYQINNLKTADAGSWYVEVSVLCPGPGFNFVMLDSKKIDLEVSPTPDARIVADSGNTLNCEITQTRLGVPGAPSNAAFSWEGPGLTSSASEINVSRGGTYLVEVSSNGCTGEDVQVITDNQEFKPTASAGTDIVLDRCGQNVTLDASSSNNGGKGNLTYEWSGPGFTYSGGNAKAQVSDAQPGTYQLTVRNQLSLCVDADAMEIDGSNLELPVADAGEEQTITCDDPEVTLGGSGSSQGSAISYSWSARQGGHIVSGEKTAQALADKAGSYELTVSNTATSCKVSAEVVVEENRTPPEVEIDPGQNAYFCSGRSLVLQAMGDADTWTWSTGESSASIEVSSPDLYVLEGERTDNGCMGIAEINVEERPTPILSPGDTSLAVAGGEAVSVSVTADPASANISWEVSDIANLDESLSSFSEAGSGNIGGTFYPVSSRSPAGITYAAHAMLDGCASDTSAIVLLARPPGLGLFIPDVFTPNGDGVNDEWLILLPDGASPAEYSLTVFDRRGRIVYQRNDLGQPWDGQNAANGVYYYAIEREQDGERIRGAVALVGRD